MDRLIEDHEHLLFERNITKKQLLDFQPIVWFEFYNWYYDYIRPNDDYYKRKNNLKHFIDNRYQKMIPMNNLLINMFTRNTSNFSQIAINKLFEINENIINDKC